ncbi:putative metallo-beta-lactamase domain protein [Phyllosticta capitalensis]|uniref:putative metallo-beta-lactamase domain protein n=1 Tax=Phyllosticta capitalensis TaxID=121624 RepID=UPI00312E667F
MAPLKTHIHQASERGLSSVTTLIVGASHCALIDPPFLIPDAHSVVSWIRAKTSNPLVAIFVTHHHPDHYFSANPILDAFPAAKLYAAPYVCAAIDREYDEKIQYWPSKLGADLVPTRPRKPEPYPFSFFSLDGGLVVLLGPVQGDSIDNTLFWLPAERTVIVGDVIYARSTHVWAEEIETPAIWAGWMSTLDTIEALNPETIVPGHLEEGWKMDAKADLAHTRKYLELFREKIANAPKKMTVDEVYKTFQEAFPQAEKNLDFFLGHLSNQFGEGGEVWEANRHHLVGLKKREELQGYIMPLPEA